MQAFLRQIMTGRLHATAWTALTGVVALMLAPLSFLVGMHCMSGAIVGLSTLRQGWFGGFYVAAGALVGSGAVMWWTVGSPIPALVLAFVLWLPASLMSGALRLTSSPGSVLAATAGVLACAVLGFRIIVGDPAQWWIEAWQTRLVPVSSTPDEASGMQDLLPELMRVLEAWAPVTSGIMAIGFLFLLILTLFLARWGHAVLDNPGGFGSEFRTLTMPRVVAHATLVLGVCVFFLSGPAADAATELVMLTMVLHMVQGLAVVHGVANLMGAARGWIVLLYVLLLLMPISSFVVLLLATVGFSDGWVRYRERVPARPT